jgi:hypothetical protein
MRRKGGGMYRQKKS